jgi:hypothetical protein
LPNTQKAIHAFKSTGSKSESAHAGARPSIGKILQFRTNCQWELLNTAAFVITGAAKEKTPKAFVGDMRHIHILQLLPKKI